MPEARIRAPELPDTLEWINTEPVRLSDLRGKIVLLNFWTSGCVNCMHMQEDLRDLLNTYRDNLVVIGIHTPKFPHDNNRGTVHKSVNRQHIKHPVAHDPINRVWTKYAIKAWPSIVFIDAEGYVVGSLRGEGRRRQIDDLIQKYIGIAQQKKILNLDQVSVYATPEPAGVLNFPGRVLATGTHLYISDSGHNRIIQANHHGRVTQIFGSGTAGLLDGVGAYAAFDNPQGLAMENDFLFVADMGNHAIRSINTQNAEIITLAGNGEMQYTAERVFADPLQTRLNSPRDLCYNHGVLFISMTGQHQIWRMELTANELSVFTGSGKENLIDGKPGEASLAQPSGMAMGEYCIYITDAETSSIRLVRLPDGQISTLIGAGRLEHGDINGGWAHARLQHPLDIVFDQQPGLIYIADTYNNKVKVMDLQSKGIRSIETGKGLDEPGGISLYNNQLWIANTNAHEIRKVNLTTNTVEVIELNEPEFDF